jgi:8-oxo-dGTP diphosphatase
LHFPRGGRNFFPVTLPYRIAALCYLFDARGRVLLLHRRKNPNKDLYSPIGGKLDRARGESPTACAAREIGEETGVSVAPADLHLTGIVSESAYEGRGHWLMFLYEVARPVAVTRKRFDEGTLEWHDPAGLMDLAIPATDRHIIWPLFWRYRRRFFTAHIRCAGGKLFWRIEQPAGDADHADRLAPAT